MPLPPAMLAAASSAKDLWELGSFQATVAAALFTLMSAVVTGAFAVWQWRKELRWKQAELARHLMDEIFDFKPSNDAWRMVDGEQRFTDEAGRPQQISMDLVRRALPRPWRNEADGPEVYVRWCFDALFYYLERLEKSVQLKLVCLEDLSAPAAYYVALMARDRELFEAYAKQIRFSGAVAFLSRFPEWRQSPEPPRELQ